MQKYIKINENFEPYITIDDLAKLRDEQPIAYDIGDVVEELKERTDFLKKSYHTMMMYEVADLVDYLIEIVKQGGVSDDVCEWKYTKEIMDNAEFKVGCNQNALKRGIVPNNFSYHDFKYCPYCRKKIKVVE